MQPEQFQVPEGYALVRIQKKAARPPRRAITRGPKVLSPSIRMAIEIAAGVARRNQAKKEAGLMGQNS